MKGELVRLRFENMTLVITEKALVSHAQAAIKALEAREKESA